MILQEFMTWHKSVEPEIDHVKELMAGSLSDEPTKLIQDLSDIEAWYARMGVFLSIANSYLDRARFELMPKKEEGTTDLTRKLQLDALASPVRMARDGIESLCDAIKQRIILGESILRYQTQFHERTIQSKEKIW